MLYPPVTPIEHRPPVKGAQSLPSNAMIPVSPVHRPHIPLDQILRHFRDLPRFIFHHEFPIFARLWLDYQHKLSLSRDPIWRPSVHAWLGSASVLIQSRLTHINGDDDDVEASTLSMLAAFIKLKDCMQCMRQVLEIIENGRIWFGQDFRSAIAPLMEIICRSRQNVTPLPVMRQVSQPTAEIIKLEHHPACYVPPVISWSSKDPQVPVTLTGNSSKIFIPTVSGQLLSPPEAPMPVTVCCPETPRVSIVSDPSQESFSSPTSAFVHPSVTHSVSTPSPEPTPSVSSTQCTTSGRTSEEELEDNSNTDNEDEELLAIDDQHDEDYRESSEDEEEEDDESGDLTWQEPTEQSRYDRLRSGEGTQQKCRRRTATSYDTETTHYLKSVFFKIYSKHEKLTKEQRLQVQRHTGLKPRNITYWFSNHKRRFQGTLEVYRQTVKQSGGQVKTYDDFLNWRSIHGFPKEMEEDST